MSFIYALSAEKKKSKLVQKNIAIFCNSIHGPAFGASNEFFISNDCINNE